MFTTYVKMFFEHSAGFRRVLYSTGVKILDSNFTDAFVHFVQLVIVLKYSILEIVLQRPVNVNALKHSEAMMIALRVLMAIMIIRTVKNAHVLSMELSK